MKEFAILEFDQRTWSLTQGNGKDPQKIPEGYSLPRILNDCGRHGWDIVNMNGGEKIRQILLQRDGSKRWDEIQF